MRVVSAVGLALIATIGMGMPLAVAEDSARVSVTSRTTGSRLPSRRAPAGKPITIDVIQS